MRLVSLAEVKRQLVYDNSLSDAQLTFRLETVSAVIMDYIGTPVEGDLDGWTDSSGQPLMETTGDPATDTNGDSLIPGPVQAATICAMAAWDENRGANLITPAVVSLLMRLRIPTVA
jgi:hypothetical protein